MRDWQVGPIGFGPTEEGPSLGLAWMSGQGFAVWLWWHVFTVGAWPVADGSESQL